MRARGSMALAMAIFGTISLFVKHIPLGSSEIVLYRALLAILVIAAYLVLRKQSIPFAQIKQELPLLLLSGIAVGVNWLLLFQAYHYTTVSIATLSYYFAPVLVTVACPILFHEKLTGRQVLCFVMSTAGLILVIGPQGLTQGGTHLVGIGLGLGAAVFYAAAVLMNKVLKATSGIHRTLIQFVGASLALLLYVPMTGGFHLSGLDGTGWLCLLVLGVVHTGFAYCLYFSSLKDLSGQEASILSYIDPLVAVVVSVAVLHEGIAPLQIVGGVMILGFTLWNELGNTQN
ncbi:MAG: DMT family transporter [Oscillibacter sp.]|nr:DMT family transporter [Oscillibacter sp.]